MNIKELIPLKNRALSTPDFSFVPKDGIPTIELPADVLSLPFDISIQKRNHEYIISKPEGSKTEVSGGLRLFIMTEQEYQQVQAEELEHSNGTTTTSKFYEKLKKTDGSSRGRTFTKGENTQITLPNDKDGFWIVAKRVEGDGTTRNNIPDSGRIHVTPNGIEEMFIDRVAVIADKENYDLGKMFHDLPWRVDGQRYGDKRPYRTVVLTEPPEKILKSGTPLDQNEQRTLRFIKPYTNTAVFAHVRDGAYEHDLPTAPAFRGYIDQVQELNGSISYWVRGNDIDNVTRIEVNTDLTYGGGSIPEVVDSSFDKKPLMIQLRAGRRSHITFSTGKTIDSRRRLITIQVSLDTEKGDDLRFERGNDPGVEVNDMKGHTFIMTETAAKEATKKIQAQQSAEHAVLMAAEKKQKDAQEEMRRVEMGKLGLKTGVVFRRKAT